MNKSQWIKTLTTITIILVSSVATVAFTLSYANLVLVATVSGMNRLEALLWPALIDFSILVFSIAGILARVTKRRHWPYLIMVSLYSGLTMYFNFPLETHYLWIVYLVAPLSFVMSFETLAGLINVAAIKSRPPIVPRTNKHKEKAIEIHTENGGNLSQTARQLNISRFKVKQLLNGDK